MKPTKELPGLAEIFDHLAPPPEEQLISVGGCCVMLEINPLQLRTLMDAADVRFSKCIDGVAYVTGVDLVKIMSECKKCRDEINAVFESVANN